MPALDITVIDGNGGLSCRLAQFAYPDHILALSVRSMVDGILTRLSQVTGSSSDPVTIGCLRIVGHGAPGIQGMGNSDRMSANVPGNRTVQILAVDDTGVLLNRAMLAQLRGCFTNQSVVELHGCNVAMGRGGPALLQALEGLWGVTVKAGYRIQQLNTVGFD